MSGAIDVKPKIVIGPEKFDRTSEPPRGEIWVGPDEAWPVYECSFWTGKILNDFLGNVYPDIWRSRATRGTPGVRPDPEHKGQLDLRDFMLTKRADGFIRVDHIIGLMPMDADSDRDVYLGYCNLLKDKDVLTRVMADGHQVNPSALNFKVSRSLRAEYGKAKEITIKKDMHDAIKKAEKGYKEWKALLESVIGAPTGEGNDKE